MMYTYDDHESRKSIVKTSPTQTEANPFEHIMYDPIYFLKID